LIEINIQK